MRPLRLISICCALSLTLAACGGSAEQEPTPRFAVTRQEGSMGLTLQSTAFDANQMIPTRYTCDGDDVSPALVWRDKPENTATFALIVDDPDAPRGVFTHWVIYDLPRDIDELPEHVPADERPATGGVQGKNDFGKIGYGGPCPPRGNAHRYRFTLYALDAALDLQPGATKRQVLDAMDGHVLDRAELIGTYKRGG